MPRDLLQSHRRAVDRIFTVEAQHGMSQVMAPEASEVHAPQLQPGDILLFLPDGTPGARMIELLTRSGYHHVALYDGDGNIIEVMPNGVGRNPLDQRPVIGVRPGVEYETRQRALRWAREQVGKHYDGRALFYIALDRLVPSLQLEQARAHHFSCASFVAEAYHNAGVDLVPGRRWQDLVPGDFAQLLGGEYAGEGEGRPWHRRTWPLAWHLFHHR